MSISLSEIPYDWLKPGAYVEVKANYDRMGVVAFPARALLIVQMLAAGSAIAGQLNRITRPDQGRALFGAGSVGADMVEAFKKANKTSDVYALALADNAGGTAATGSVAFTGTATASGVFAFYVGDVRIPVAVTVGMTAAQLATALAAAITAIATLPVTATAATGTVTLTARHKGEVGNGIQLAMSWLDGEIVPAGITAVITAMANGALNPSLQTALDAIATEWFTDIAVAWDDTANLGVLSADLAQRYQAMGKKDGHAYVGSRGNFAALTTKGGLVNSPFISIAGLKGSQSSPWEMAASAAGIATFQLANDPARQLRTLAMPAIVAPRTVDRFTETEQDLLLKGGISTFTAQPDGTVTIDRVVTTYKTSPLGVTDRAWLDIMIPKTASRIRYDWAAYVSLVYPRCKLADDGSPAAEQRDSVVTPKRLLASWASRCQLYGRLGWIENIDETIAQAVFERDESDHNRVNARQPIQIIGNFMVLAASLEFLV